MSLQIELVAWPVAPPEPEQPPVQSFDLYRVKRWGEDAVMKFHDYTTRYLSTGNFSVVGVLVEDQSGMWHQNQVGFKVEIDHESILKVHNLQKVDDPEFSTDQKMRWLMNGEKGRPYFFPNGDWKWQTAPYVHFGPMVYGGQLVAIDEYREVFGTYRSRKRQKMACGRIVAFTRADWNKNPDDYPWLIQNATAAYKRKIWDQFGNVIDAVDDIYVDRPRGVIKAPLFAPSYGKFNGLGGTQPKEYMIPLEMLVKV